MTFMIFYEMTDEDLEQENQTHNFVYSVNELKETLKISERKIVKVSKLYKDGKSVDVTARFIKNI